MSKARWLVFPLLTFGLVAASLSACSNGDGRPSSLVSSPGDPGHGDGFGGHGGTSPAPGSAGQTQGDGGSDGEDAAGAAGEANTSPGPLAIFPKQLQVDVGCGASTSSTALLIHNGGSLPLVITSAKGSAGYKVDAELPLQIPPAASAILNVSAAARPATASVGDTSTGTLIFETNEADSPSHEIQLDTTLFGGLLEFTNVNDEPLKGALPLTYLSSDACPDRVRYRVHNSGNLAFTLFGPTFPAHLGGTTAPVSGQDVAPDSYIELEVTGNSSTDGACSGSGELSFVAQGSLCNAVPKLRVTWPANVATSGCSCVASD
ncbi:MAG TPA: hypothetical protein VER96_17790 [Polyangiaceae bacterium]|nr:hypothetical protein [Polyangiaceae bacterium]